MSKQRRASRLDEKADAPSSSASGSKKASVSSSSSSASSSSRSSAGSASTADFLRRDELLQAVLLADSFTSRFRPITLQTPKVLLPLLSLPLIDYALELLVSGGVKELFVFCCSHAEAIRAHVAGSRVLKGRGGGGCSVRVVVSKDCYSAGDALRHLDSLDVIKGDFVLMTGDVVANVRLDDIVRQHRERAREDKGALMTVVLKQAASQHRVRPRDDDTMLALDPATSQLLVYHNSFASPTLTPPLPTAVFSSHPTVSFRCDLLDAGIDVCSPLVLPLLTDNFDYQHLRRDFIPGVLGQEDVLGYTIYAHVLTGEQYAVSVSDLHVYGQVSRDMLRRWAFPFVLDANLLGDGAEGATSFTYERGSRYREEGVVVEREAVLGEDCVLGRGTTLAEGSSVDRTVIGRHCSIGRRARITGSFLWRGVTVEEGATVTDAILCDNVRVRKGATVQRGCVLSYGVVIGEGAVVPEYSKVTRVQQQDEVFEEDSPHPSDAAAEEEGETAVVGAGGRGRRYVEEKQEDEDEEETPSFERLNSIAMHVGDWKQMWRRKQELEQDAESDDDWDADQQADDDQDDGGEQRVQANAADSSKLMNGIKVTVSSSSSSSNTSASSASSSAASGSSASSSTASSASKRNGSSEDDGELPRFYSEAIATLQRGHSERLPVDAIALEMASLKLSHDAGVLEYIEACFLALFSFVPLPAAAAAQSQPQAQQLSQQELLSVRRSLFSSPSSATLRCLVSLLNHWQSVLFKFGSSTADQVLVIRGLARACQRWGGVYAGAFAPVLQLMTVNCEVLEEEAVWEWERAWTAEHGRDDAFLKQAADFLKWLREAEEEEEEDDEADGDEDG